MSSINIKEMIWSTSDLYNQFLNWNFIIKLIKKRDSKNNNNNKKGWVRHSTVSLLKGTALPFLMLLEAPWIVDHIWLECMCFQQSSCVTFPSSWLGQSVSGHSADHQVITFPRLKTLLFFPALNASFLSLESQAPNSEK